MTASVSRWVPPDGFDHPVGLASINGQLIFVSPNVLFRRANRKVLLDAFFVGVPLAPPFARVRQGWQIGKKKKSEGEGIISLSNFDNIS